jgi:hypothetical protein
VRGLWLAQRSFSSQRAPSAGSDDSTLRRPRTRPGMRSSTSCAWAMRAWRRSGPSRTYSRRPPDPQVGVPRAAPAGPGTAAGVAARSTTVRTRYLSAKGASASLRPRDRCQQEPKSAPFPGTGRCHRHPVLVVVRAAVHPARTPLRVRLTLASPGCCDGQAVESFPVHAVMCRLVAVMWRLVALDVGDPEPVGGIGDGAALDQVAGPIGGVLVGVVVRTRRPRRTPSSPLGAHEPADAVAADRNAAPAQLAPGLAHPVDAAVSGARGVDLAHRLGVADRPRRQGPVAVDVELEGAIPRVRQVGSTPKRSLWSM